MRRLTLLALGIVFSLGTLAQAGPVRGTEIPFGSFYIQSALEYQRSTEGFWDVPGNPQQVGNDDPIQVWALSDRAHDRMYRPMRTSYIDGQDYYLIKCGMGSENILAYTDGKKEKKAFRKDKVILDRGQIVAWRNIRSDRQTWYFEHVGDGRFKIKNVNGQVIGLANRSTQGGTKLMIQPDMGGLDQQWVLIDSRTNQAFVPAQQQTQTAPQHDGQGKQKKTLKDLFK